MCQQEIYPYMVVRLMPAVYQRVPLPKEMLPEDMQISVRRHCRETGLRCCLVMGPEASIYFEPDGSETGLDDIPRGGMEMD